MPELKLPVTTYYPILQVGILTIATLICYLIAYYRGDVSIYLPFISETGAYSPEKCVFSLSLILGSFLGTVTVILYHVLLKQEAGRVFYYLNIISLIVGMIAMIGLAGVAAFPMTTVFSIHLLCAAIYFVGSAIYMMIITYITFRIEQKSNRFVFRCVISVAITAFLFLISIIFPISLVKWHKQNDFIPALKTPGNEGFTLLLLSSILEYAIVIAIILFHLSLIKDLKDFEFKIVAISDKNTPVNEDAVPAPAIIAPPEPVLSHE